MWGRKRQNADQPASADGGRLRQAVQKVRVESAERTGVVVDLRDAELARLEMLNEALDPLFAELPPEVDLFDRGITHGEPPRLWVDMIAHVFMARDKRQYRFVQDTRYGRRVLAEATEIAPMVEAVTHYVASRLVERERALAADTRPLVGENDRDLTILWRNRRWRWLRAFLFGLVMGCVSLFAALWIVASNIPK